MRWRIELGPEDVRVEKMRRVARGRGPVSAEAALKIRDVSSVKRGDLPRASGAKVPRGVPLLDVDDALDAEHDKEADAALRKWREALFKIDVDRRPRAARRRLRRR